MAAYKLYLAASVTHEVGGAGSLADGVPTRVRANRQSGKT